MTERNSRTATMPWWAAVIGGVVSVAAGGWALASAPIVIGQVSAGSTIAGDYLSLGTRIWLLAHGGPIVVGGLPVSLAPLGLTAFIGLALHGIAGYSAKQAVLAGGDAGPKTMSPGLVTLVVTALSTVLYAAIVTGVVVLTNASTSPPRAISGALVLALVSAFLGARRAASYIPPLPGIAWAGPVTRSVVAMVLVAALGGISAIIAALLAHHDAVVMTAIGLDPGTAGHLALGLGEIAYLLTAVIWAVAWIFGIGFTLGDGSIVSPIALSIGVLPPVPILAAIPTTPSSWLGLLWLAWPIAAGIVGALVLTRALRTTRIDLLTLACGICGIAAGLVIAVVGWISRGDVGSGRLTGLGPPLGPLFLIAPSALGLVAALTGLAVSLVRRHRAAGADKKT
ncbi:MAG: DUF6350 family protein [Propionibacteriaceae bacterium]|jgi:hypothetical protein|nr:DUF6350 family protein [Propionibacteriaceae bacterium]